MKNLMILNSIIRRVNKLLKEINTIFYKHYHKYYMSLKEIAFDSANNEYPSNLRNKMFNFDAIANSVYSLNQELMPCSPDAIYIADKVYFIEFKNGRLDTPDKKRNLRLKFAEGPYIILAKILKNKNIQFNKLDFFKLPKVGIVIYNGNKNPSDVLQMRYNSRFQLDEYHLTLYDQIYTFTFKQFDRMVREGKKPFAFLKDTI